MADKTPAIRVEGVYKSFRLPHERQTSVKSALINIRKTTKGYEKQQVLESISFQVEKGDFFGIVGRNGSGKSTLLKLLAGIYTPDEGEIELHGRLTPFIELGVGFNPELSGRENVFLNGALLGFSRKEMEVMYDEIVAFAELERFMDQRLKNYSSGMQVRLAFSIAIRAQSDIYLIDEVLAVGDTNFQKKCFDVFRRIKQEGRTVIFVTHDMSAVKEFCNKALLLSKGKIEICGDIDEVTEKYAELNGLDLGETGKRKQVKRVPGTAKIKSCTFRNGGKNKHIYEPKDAVRCIVEIEALQDVVKPVLGIIVRDQNAVPIFATNTTVSNCPLPSLSKGERLAAAFNIDNVFGDGNYFVEPSLASSDGLSIYDQSERGYMFTVKGWRFPAYVMQPKHDVSILT